MIFLDVGAHDGQTLEEVTKPEYGFTIFAFEPMPREYQTLLERFGGLPNVTLFNFGLADSTGPRTMYGSNAKLEASLFAAKADVDASLKTVCAFVRATDFLAGLPADEPITMKLNCEGGEVAILDDLISSGAIWRLANVMVDFDIRKVPGQEGEAERVLARLDELGVVGRYHLCEHVMIGATHQDAIAHWLQVTA